MESNDVTPNLILARRPELHLCHANGDSTPRRHIAGPTAPAYHKLLRRSKGCANVANHKKLGLSGNMGMFLLTGGGGGGGGEHVGLRLISLLV